MAANRPTRKTFVKPGHADVTTANAELINELRTAGYAEKTAEKPAARQAEDKTKDTATKAGSKADTTK